LLLPRKLALLEVELALFLPCFVELRTLPKMLGLPVPMWASVGSHLTQPLLLPRKLALLEVELALFLPRLIELRTLPKMLALLEVELALFLPCLMELRLTGWLWR
jgi:hypothetical protein